MKHFINFSGGVDSTYYLWKHLFNNPEERILVHHCVYGDVRKDAEKIATENILEWLRDNNYRNFEYIESRFTRKGFGGKIMDIEPIYFMAGLILKNKKQYPDIQHIFVPICYEEMGRPFKSHLEKGGDWKGYRQSNCRFRKSFLYCNTASGRKFEYHTPYYSVTKEQMIAEMPKELVDMIWYCRKPIDGKPCSACFNCRRVHEAFKSLKYEG